MARVRVLVVDDDPLVRLSVSRALATLDVEVATAAGAGDALAKLGAETFERVLADFSLGDGSGLDVIELAWRSRVSRGRPPPELVLMTGTDDREAANRAHDLGARFLHKPFDPSSLEKFVARARARATRIDALERELARVEADAGFPRRPREAFRLIARFRTLDQIREEMGVGVATARTYVSQVVHGVSKVARTALEDRKDVGLYVMSRVIGIEYPGADRRRTLLSTRSTPPKDDDG